MSKISIALLISEFNSWLKLKNELENSLGKMINFGKYMNNKYLFNDKELIIELDINLILLKIMRDHVQEIK
jgi:hypothetical protein